MNEKEFLAASAAYNERFDNGDELSHPECLEQMDELTALMVEAVRRGAPITRAELEAKFGPISWDW